MCNLHTFCAPVEGSLIRPFTLGDNMPLIWFRLQCANNISKSYAPCMTPLIWIEVINSQKRKFSSGVPNAGEENRENLVWVPLHALPVLGWGFFRIQFPLFRNFLSVHHHRNTVNLWWRISHSYLADVTEAQLSSPNLEEDYIYAVFEISVGPTVRDREVVCRTDNKLNLPVLLSDNISDRVFTNL